MRLILLFWGALLPFVDGVCAQEATPPANVVTVSTDSYVLPEMPVVRPAARACGAVNPFCLEPDRENIVTVQPATVRPKSDRAADKKFWFAAGAAIGTSVLVVKATEHCRSTVGIEHCMGGYGEFKGVQGTQIGFSALMTTIGFFWKRADQRDGIRHSPWWAFPVGVAIGNGMFALHQYSKHCSGGQVFNGEECR